MAPALSRFSNKDIPVLVKHGLSQPLGNPTQSASKYFAAVEILAVSSDPDFLHKATKVVSQTWQKRNAKKRNRNDQGDEFKSNPGNSQAASTITVESIP